MSKEETQREVKVLEQEIESKLEEFAKLGAEIAKRMRKREMLSKASELGCAGNCDTCTKEEQRKVHSSVELTDAMMMTKIKASMELLAFHEVFDALATFRGVLDTTKDEIQEQLEEDGVPVEAALMMVMLQVRELDREVEEKIKTGEEKSLKVEIANLNELFKDIKI